ncbi:hypothetical protein KP509_30G051800 [Ceratopteris richardii]|nr:hypothetical protein KP509_30G051800 [Ceratopteris richardii]
MYYKKRPELINLVEEFYRTYRALVERYTFLTKEIRQNIAPALQAQLGFSSESPQNSPVDLHLKRGIDGPDIISPSYSYAGASEFDYDSPLSMKGQTDDEFSPLGFQTNYERRAFGFRARYSNFEDSSCRITESGAMHNSTDADVDRLQKEILHLQEENKNLALKATQDASKLKDLQQEMSSMQSRTRSLEAEDKLTKKRLNSILEKEQKLEAENLKLSHALISFKEERTEILEQQKRIAEENRQAHEKIGILEDEKMCLNEKVLEIQSKHSEISANFSKREELVQELHQTLTELKEEKLKDKFLLEIFEQQNQDLFVKVSDLEKSNAETLERACLHSADAQKLQDQLADILKSKKLLEQDLTSAFQEKEYAENQETLALSQVEELKREIQGIQKDKERLVEEIAKLKEIIDELEKEYLRAQSEKMESANCVCELKASLEEEQSSKEAVFASCKQYMDRCKDLESKLAESNEKLVSSSEEVSKLQCEVQALKDTATSLQSQHEEFQDKIFSLLLEKKSLIDELLCASENAHIVEQDRMSLRLTLKDQKGEIEKYQKELENLLDCKKELEEELVSISAEKTALVEKESQTLMAHQQLGDELIRLNQELELNAALIKGLDRELCCFKLEKDELLLETQKVQENILELQTSNAILSNQCTTGRQDLQEAEKIAREAQEELSLTMLEVEKLQNDIHIKGETLRETVSTVETLQVHLLQCREENGLLTKQINETTDRLVKMEASNKDLKSEISYFSLINESLSEKVSDKEKNLEQLNAQLGAAKKRALEFSEDVTSKEAQILDLRQQVSNLERELELLQTQLLESSSMKCRLELEVERLHQENSEINEINQSLNCEKDRLANAIHLLNCTNQGLEAKWNALQKERVSLQEDVILKLSQCDELKQKIMNLEIDYEVALEEKEILKGKLAEYEKESMSLAEKFSEAEGRVQDLQLKFCESLTEKASMIEQLTERIRTIHFLQTAAFDLQKDNASLIEEKKLLQQQSSTFETKEASLLTKIHDSAITIQDLRAEVQGLQQQVSILQESEKKILAEQKDRTSECESLQQQIVKLELSLNIQCQENEIISLEHKERIKECQSLQQQVKELELNLNVCCEEKASFQKEVGNYSEQCNELESEVRRLGADKICLQQDLLKAQQMEHELTMHLNNLKKEQEQFSGALGSQQKIILQQEEHVQALQEPLLTKDQELGAAVEETCKLQTSLKQLQQAMSSAEIELENRTKEFDILKESMLLVEYAKVGLEQKMESCTGRILQHDEKMLPEKLDLAHEENAKLEQQLPSTESRMVQIAECDIHKEDIEVLKQENLKLKEHLENAQRRIIDTEKEFDEHRRDFEMLKEELGSAVIARKGLERELVQLQGEKATSYQQLEGMCRELRCLKEQKDIADANLQSAILQGHEHMSKLANLQEVLAHSVNLELETAEKLAKATAEWITAERRMQEEILQLKSELESQTNTAFKLENELHNIKADKEVIETEKASLEAQVIEWKLQASDLKTHLLQKKEECLQMCSQTELESQTSAAFRLENDLDIVKGDKEVLETEKASLEAQVLDLKQQASDLKARLLQKEQQCLEMCSQAELSTVKGNLIVELQKQVHCSSEENKLLQRKLQNNDKELARVNANLEILEGELHELQEKLCESQFESQEKELSCQALAEENASIKERNRELTNALFAVDEENAVLEIKLAEKAKTLDTLHKDPQLKEDEEETLKRPCLHQTDAIMEVHAEKEGDSSAPMSRFLHSQVLGTSRLHQQETEYFNNPNDVQLLQHKIVVEREENAKLVKRASENNLAIKKHQEEVSILHDSIKCLESTLKQLETQVNEATSEKGASVCAKQDHSQKLHQMIKEMENLNGMISKGLECRQTTSSTAIAADNVDCNGSFIQNQLLQDTVEITGAISSNSEYGQESLFDAMADLLDRVKGKVLVLLKINHQTKSIMSLQNQEQASDLEEEISNFKLYREDLVFLKKFIHGESQREAEFMTEDAKVIHIKLCDMQSRLNMLEGHVKEVKEQTERESIQKRNLQIILTDCQTKGLSFILLLKNNLLLSCKGLKALANEWNEKTCNKESHQFINFIAKLSRIEDMCDMPDSQYEQNTDRKETQACLGVDSELPVSFIFMLEKLEKRVEESNLFAQAIEIMLPSKQQDDQYQDEAEQELVNDAKQSKDGSPIDHKQDSLPYSDKENTLLTENLGSDVLCSSEMADSIVEEISEEFINEDSEITENISFTQGNDGDLVEGLAQLHINLGMRLHQALLDEKLENELQELKEEKEKLKEDLQARIQQVQRTEAELEKLQAVLRGANEGDTVDSRQQQQWVHRKKRAEKKAKRLSKELLTQRQHVGQLQDAVVAWTEQQELATELLEKQVVTLVSKECAPTMEGWDADRVTELMKDMQNRKALTRRHSMDLHTVGKDLQKVGSSIENTQRFLVEEEIDQGDPEPKYVTEVASDPAKNQGKFSRFGLPWSLLHFSSVRSSSKANLNGIATTVTSKQAQRHGQQIGNHAKGSLVAQTKKMRCCCTCARSSDFPRTPSPSIMKRTQPISPVKRTAS